MAIPLNGISAKTPSPTNLPKQSPFSFPSYKYENNRITYYLVRACIRFRTIKRYCCSNFPMPSMTSFPSYNDMSTERKAAAEEIVCKDCGCTLMSTEEQETETCDACRGRLIPTPSAPLSSCCNGSLVSQQVSHCCKAPFRHHVHDSDNDKRCEVCGGECDIRYSDVLVCIKCLKPQPSSPSPL